jgi:hypothetical protein
MKITQIRTLNEMAVKRRLGDEMSNERAMQLLQRRIKHSENRSRSGHANFTAITRVFNYPSVNVVKRLPDMSSMAPDNLTRFRQSHRYRAEPMFQEFDRSPNNFYVYKTKEFDSDYGANYIYIGDKQALATKRLDEEDFIEYVEATEDDNRVTNTKSRMRGTLDRVTKRYNEEQAAALAKQAAAQGNASSTSGPLPAPPTTVTLSPKNANLRNPYYRGTNQWRGNPVQTPWAKNSIKMMMNVVIVALNNLGYPLVDMQHSVDHNGEDSFYTYDAKGMVKIYVIGTGTNEMLIAINNRSYRLKRSYAANNIPQTTDNLKNLFNYAGHPLP